MRVPARRESLRPRQPAAVLPIDLEPGPPQRPAHQGNTAATGQCSSERSGCGKAGGSPHQGLPQHKRNAVEGVREWEGVGRRGLADDQLHRHAEEVGQRPHGQGVVGDRGRGRSPGQGLG